MFHVIRDSEMIWVDICRKCIYIYCVVFLNTKNKVIVIQFGTHITDKIV